MVVGDTVPGPMSETPEQLPPLDCTRKVMYQVNRIWKLLDFVMPANVLRANIGPPPKGPTKRPLSVYVKPLPSAAPHVATHVTTLPDAVRTTALRCPVVAWRPVSASV